MHYNAHQHRCGCQQYSRRVRWTLGVQLFQSKVYMTDLDEACRTRQSICRFRKAARAEITFSNKDVVDILPHKNDPMVIIVQYNNWDLKRILIDRRSSLDTLFYDAFERL